MAQAEELWSSLLFSYCSISPAPAGPQNLQTYHQCDLICITPSCILFFLGCLVFFFLIFLSLFSQHWNCVELEAQSRGSGWFGIDLGGFLRGPAFYPRDTWTYIFLVCLLCSIPQSFLRRAWPCEQEDRGSHVNCDLQNLLGSRTLLIVGCHIN